MSSASHSYGSTIGIGVVASGTYVTIAEVVDINAPDIKIASTKVTHLTSANAFQEKIPGLGDGGEIQLKLNFVKAGFATIYGYLRVLKDFLITFADGSTMLATGFINGIKISAPGETHITVDIGIEVTGKPVFTAAA
jgi:hypothetical protein